ncbi:hypothetical protein ACWEGT_43755, partial [Amycolatopsis japonica]
AQRSKSGYRALRTDGIEQDLSSSELAQSLRDGQSLRDMLGTQGASLAAAGTEISVMLASLGGPALGLAEFAAGFVPAGYSRTFYGPSGELEFGQAGVLDLTGPGFERIEPIVPGPQHLASYERVNAKLGTTGQFFPSQAFDRALLSPMSLREEEPVHQHFYYSVTTVPDGQGGEQEVSVPYLMPLKPGVGRLRTDLVHALPAGFIFSMTTGRRDVSGDLVQLVGEPSAAAIYGSDVFRRGHPGAGDQQVLISCWANATAGPGEESPAFQLKKAAEESPAPQLLIAADNHIVVDAAGKRTVQAGGHFREVGSHADPIPLSDLAAIHIAEAAAFRQGANADVRRLARDVARAAAWRARNNAGLPAVEITGHGVTVEAGRVVAAALEPHFREEYRLEQARLAELGLPAPDVVVRLTGAAYSDVPDHLRTAEGAIRVELPAQELGFSALLTGNHFEISAAFAALAPDHAPPAPNAPGSGPAPAVTMGPSSAQAVERDEPSAAMGGARDVPMEDAEDVDYDSGLDADGETDSSPGEPVAGSFDIPDLIEQGIEQIAQMKRHLAALPPDFAPDFRARVDEWHENWATIEVAGQHLPALVNKVASARQLTSRLRDVRLADLGRLHEAAQRKETPLTFHAGGIPDGVGTRPDARLGFAIDAHGGVSFDLPLELSVYGRLAQLNKAFESVLFRLGSHDGTTANEQKLQDVSPNPVPPRVDRIDTFGEVMGLSTSKEDALSDDALSFAAVWGEPGDRLGFRFWAGSRDPAAWQVRAEISAAMVLAAQDPSIHRRLDELMVDPRLLGHDPKPGSRKEELGLLLDFLELLPLSPAAQEQVVGMFASTEPWTFDGGNDSLLRARRVTGHGGLGWLFPTRADSVRDAVRTLNVLPEYPGAQIVSATITPGKPAVEMWLGDPVAFEDFAVALESSDVLGPIAGRFPDEDGDPRLILAVEGGLQLGETIVPHLERPVLVTDGPVRITEDGRLEAETGWIQLSNEEPTVVHTGLKDAQQALNLLQSLDDEGATTMSGVSDPVGEPLAADAQVPADQVSGEDIVWVTPKNAHGTENMMVSVHGEAAEGIHRLAILATEHTDRTLGLTQKDANGLRLVHANGFPLRSELPVDWPGDISPLRLFLEVRDGRFLMPLRDGRHTLLTPEEAAEKVAASSTFDRLTAGPVRPPLALITKDTTVQPDRSLNEAFLAKLIELTGPWQSRHYIGSYTFDDVGVMIVDEPFMAGPLLALDDVKYSTSGFGSVFGFGTLPADEAGSVVVGFSGNELSARVD